MPNRILRDSIRTSKSLAGLTAEEFRHFTLLMVTADDFGRFDARPEIIKGLCYPLQDGVKAADAAQWTQRLAADDVRIIQIYEVDGYQYGVFLNWDKYQQRRANKSKFPPPPADDINCNHMPADSLVVMGNGIEVMGNGIECEDAVADAPEAANAAHTPANAPEFVKILSEVPGWAEHGQPPEHCVQYLERKGITLERAEETALQLKAKWGGKGWKWKDPWATFQDWVMKPPRAGPSPPNTNGAHHRNGAKPTGGANGIASGNTTADFEAEQRKLREFEQSRARGGNGGAGKA